MKSLKTLVRAISPFTAKRKNDQKDKESEHSDSEQESTSYNWDLSNIDLEVGLRSFYKAFNPDKVNTIGTILEQYKDEENLLLQTLCERYKLDKDEMQYFLDKGKNKRRHESSPSVASRHDSENESVKSKSKSRSPDYNNFNWNLAHVDVGGALKQLYKECNPSKSPNTSLLADKDDDEIITLLRQLCKRHALSEADMQRYLDKNNRKRKKERKDDGPQSPTARLFNDTTPSSNNQRKSGHHHSKSYPDGSSPRDKSRSGSIHSPPPLSDTRIASSSGMVSPPPPPPPPLNNNTGTSVLAPSQGPPPPPPQSGMSPTGRSGRTGSISRPPPPAFNSAVATPSLDTLYATTTSTATTREPLITARSLPSKVPFQTNNDHAAQDDVASDNSNSVVSSSSRAHLSMDLRPMMSNGKRFSMGPVLRDLQQTKKPTHTIIHSGPSEDDDSVDTSEQSLQQHTPFASSSQPFIQQEEFAVTRRAQSIHSAAAVVNVVPDTRMEEMKRELDVARQQIVEVTKDSQEVLRMLRESANVINTNTTALTKIQSETIKERQQAVVASPKKSQAVAAQSTLELSKLREQVQSDRERIERLEEKEYLLNDKCFSLQRQVEELQCDLERSRQTLSDVMADRSDLLQLISVMHASPVAVKNVLESFLVKLGQSTGNAQVQLGIGKDGVELTVSDRVALALEIKRQQKKEITSILSSSSPSVSPVRIVTSAISNSLHDDSSGPHTKRLAVQAATSTSTASPRQQEQGESSTLNISEAERKMFQSVSNYNNNSKKTTNGGNSSRSSSRDASPSLKFIQRSMGNTVSNVATTESDTKAKQLMTDQYELAKQYYQSQQSQARIAEQLANSNLALQELQTESVIGRTVESHHRVQSLNETRIADDWIECYDPRTKRQYYYSATLKKSTWHRPQSNTAILLKTTETGKSTARITSKEDQPPSRYNSPSLSKRDYEAFSSTQQQQQLSNANANTNYLSDSEQSTGDSPQQLNIDLYSRLQQQQQQQQYQQFGRGTPMTADELMLASSSVASSTDSGSFARNHSKHALQQQQQQQQQHGVGMQYGGRGGQQGMDSPQSVRSEISSSSSTMRYSSVNSRPVSASRGGGGGSAPPPFTQALHTTPTGTIRSSSPQLPTRSHAQSSSQQQSMVWVTAVDPRTQRKYWYNRETKVSTWRKPAELD